jgi:putative two-component system response regulator
MSHEQAVQIIIEGSGKHFDSDIVDAFLELQEDFKMIAAQFADSDEDLVRAC